MCPSVMLNLHPVGHTLNLLLQRTSISTKSWFQGFHPPTVKHFWLIYYFMSPKFIYPINTSDILLLKSTRINPQIFSSYPEYIALFVFITMTVPWIHFNSRVFLFFPHCLVRCQHRVSPAFRPMCTIEENTAGGKTQMHSQLSF